MKKSRKPPEELKTRWNTFRSAEPDRPYWERGRAVLVRKLNKGQKKKKNVSFGKYTIKALNDLTASLLND